MVSTLNNELTRLIRMKPVDAIKETLVEQDSLNLLRITKRNYSMLVPRLDIFMNLVSCMEGQIYKGERRKRTTDPIWSVDVYKIKDTYVQKQQPTLYCLDGEPKQSFVFEELQPILDP